MTAAAEVDALLDDAAWGNYLPMVAGLAPIVCPFCQGGGGPEPCALHRDRRDAYDGYVPPAQQVLP